MTETLATRSPAAADPAACRICGNARTGRFSANGFMWVKCPRCSAIQKDLTFEQYLALNPTYDPGSYLDTKDRAAIEAYLDVDDKAKLLSGVTRRHWKARPDSPSFLDVGCGMGGYLLAAKSLGFDALGFEPSRDHARVATEILKLPVVGDYFSPQALDGRKFDLIMLSHVIEHIYRPVEMIGMLVASLKPGGILVVVTPNSDSFIASLSGKDWVMLRPIDHVSMISAKAYDHFHLDRSVEIHHRWSEYSWEFAATLLAGVKQRRAIARAGAPAPRSPGPSPLRGGGLKSRLLKAALAVASFPAYALAAATGRQACLTTVLVRRGP